MRSGKTKAWIVIGTPDYYDDLLTLPAQQIQAMKDQSTDAPAQVFPTLAGGATVPT